MVQTSDNWTELRLNEAKAFWRKDELGRWHGSVEMNGKIRWFTIEAGSLKPIPDEALFHELQNSWESLKDKNGN